MLGSEISHYFEKRKDLREHYLGWTCIDALPDLLPLRKYLVLNTCESASQGEHWLAVGRYSDEIIEVFNSLGKNSSILLLLSSKYKGEYEYNETRFQPLTSNKCGLYAITFIEERLKNFDLSMAEVLEEIFSQDPEKNDAIVESFIADNAV